ncbi:hypothetical protein MXB_950, partial [Myxobolus squamalis]
MVSLGERAKKTEKMLHKYQFMCEEKQLNVELYSSFDKVHEGIILLSQKLNVDLIVIGSKNIPSQNRAIGGTCSYVVHHSTRAV